MEMVIDRQILPEPLFSYLQTEKIRLYKEDGRIVLTPVKNKPNVNELVGMFKDGNISSDEFIALKSAEKEMEL